MLCPRVGRLQSSPPYLRPWLAESSGSRGIPSNRRGPVPDGPQANGQNGLPPTQKWDDSFGTVSDAGVYLLAVGPKDSPRRRALEVWKTLVTDMAADTETQALLRRLYNDLPVDVAVLPDKAAKEGKPWTGRQVLQVTGSPLSSASQPRPRRRLVAATGSHPSGARDMRVKPGEKSANFIQRDGNAVSSQPPNDFAVILFAMNDYLLQKGRATVCLMAGLPLPKASGACCRLTTSRRCGPTSTVGWPTT